MAIILGLELKMTGSDAKRDYVFDIAGVVWDTRNNRILKSYSSLVNPPTKPQRVQQLLDDVIMQCHPIQQEQLERRYLSFEQTVDFLEAWLNEVDYTFMHNCETKQAFLCDAYPCDLLMQEDWIEMITDIPYPPDLIDDWSIQGIARSHGLVNPFPNQALSDLMMMLSVLSRYDFENVRKRVKRKFEKMRAGMQLVS